jgi:predicted metallo-beta-lactamase superfamily hydrolase
VKIAILGADSFGPRSLATSVVTSQRRILIDPGVAVCPKRDGRPPHPLELVELERVRAAIQEHACDADIIIITHFHHDHYTSFEDRKIDLSGPETARRLYGDKPVYVKAWQRKLNRAQKRRALEFVRALGRRVTPADGQSFDHVTFSPSVKHGEEGSKQGWVIMVLVEDRGERLIYASDIQLIERESVDWILERQPSTLIVSGPPIYLAVLAKENVAKAHANLMRLAEAVPIIVVDHHLLRTCEFEDFLAEPRRIAETRGNRILTAAGFMGRADTLLEARRKELWADGAESDA